MELNDLPVGAVDWSLVPAKNEAGQTGAASVRTCEYDEIRLRMIDYGPGYGSVPWAHKGQVVLVLSGQLTVEHQDGKKYALGPGTMYHVGDEEGAPYRVVSESGARAFVMD